MNTDTRHLTAKEKKERNRLHPKWATRKATKAEISRCMELDQKAACASAAACQ